MEGKDQKITQNRTPNPANEEGHKPALHTMQSDSDELLKITDPSLLKRIDLEAAKRDKPKIGAGILLSLSFKTYLRVGVGVAILLLLLGGWYFLMPIFTATPEELQPVKLVPPPQLFASEASRTISFNSRDVVEFLRLMEDSYREPEREGTIKRIAVKLQDGPRERFMTAADFFEFYRLTPPQNILEAIEKDVMPFFYYGQDGTRFGAAMRVKNYDRAFAGMLDWEASLLGRFKPLFFNENPDVLFSSQFEDRTYRNIDWRFLKLSPEKDLGIAYTVFPAKNVLVITTSKASMETAINRLFDAR